MTATITTFESPPVDARVEPWAVTDEDAAILRHDFGDDRRLTYWLPRRAIPVDFDGHQATINVDPVEVVRWATFVDHVKADVVFSGKPAELLLWFALDLEGISAVESDGRVDLIDTDTGALVGVLPRPFLLDADRTRHECAWATGTGCILAHLPDLDEQLWLGAVFDPTTIDTATSTVPTGYANQKKLVRLSTGMLVAVFAATTTNGEFWYSSDNGATWTQYSGSDIAGWTNGSIHAYLDSGGTERIVAVWKQSGAGGGRLSNDRYVVVGTFNAGRTTITWGTEQGMFALQSSPENFLDVVCHPESTGGVAHIVGSVTSGGVNLVEYYKVPINSSGVIGTIATISLDASYGTGAELYPSIDVDLATKRLHVAWSAGASGAGKGIRYRTAAYSAGAWTWATEVEVDNTRWLGSAAVGVICRWDGTRVVIGGCVTAASNTDLVIWDSTSFTAFTLRASATGLADSVTYYGPSLAVEAVTGDVYVYGSQFNGSAYADTAYIKATRSGTALSLGSRTVLATFTGQAGVPPYINARYDATTRSIEWVYDGSSGSPYNVRFDRVVFNTAPTAAPWVTASGPADIAASLATDWTFADPEPSDTQSAYALKRDIGGTIRYWRASDSTWQSGEVKNVSSASIVTQSSGWGLDGDADHVFYVKTWDALDAEGVYNTALTITPSAKVNPTLDTPAAGATVGLSSLDAAWTVAQQSAYLLELLDSAGTTVLATAGGGYVTDVSARTRTIPYTLANGTSYKVRLTTKNAEGLPSTSVTHSITVSYTAPATPTVAISVTSNRKVVLAISNPAPSGGQPALSENRVWRRAVGDTSDGDRVATGIASGATFEDLHVGHLEDLEYRIEAVGVNTTSKFGAWTS